MWMDGQRRDFPVISHALLLYGIQASLTTMASGEAEAYKIEINMFSLLSSQI
jgi:hypothetical protein